MTVFYPPLCLPFSPGFTSPPLLLPLTSRRNRKSSGLHGHLLDVSGRISDTESEGSPGERKKGKRRGETLPDTEVRRGSGEEKGPGVLFSPERGTPDSDGITRGRLELVPESRYPETFRMGRWNAINSIVIDDIIWILRDT